jgi:hypothetical protein
VEVFVHVPRLRRDKDGEMPDRNPDFGSCTLSSLYFKIK